MKRIVATVLLLCSVGLAAVLMMSNVGCKKMTPPGELPYALSFIEKRGLCFAVVVSDTGIAMAQIPCSSEMSSGASEMP